MKPGRSDDVNGKRVVHVVPVGFEEDRAVFGLMELGASRIYLLIDGKPDSWGDEARKHAEQVKDRLKQVMFDSASLIEVTFDPTTYRSCEETVTKILEGEKDADRIYLNISSSTKLCAVAFALKASEYGNALLYYVVPEVYNLPKEGRPFSSGASRIEVWSPRIFKFGDMERVIMEALESRTFASLGELNETIIPDDMSKASRAKLSYYVRKLQQEGFIEFIPGKKITLLPLGKSKLHPPKDDAQRILISKSAKADLAT
jgi:hypothetical protein